MTQFFKTLTLVALNLTLLVLAGCGIAQPPLSRYDGFPTTTMNYFPDVTTTTMAPVIRNLSCSISADSTTVTTNSQVNLTVTADGGSSTGQYTFSKLIVDYSDLKDLAPASSASTNFKASVSLSFSNVGQHRVEASVSKNGQTVSCPTLTISVQTVGVTLSAVSVVGQLGGSITVTPNPQGFDVANPPIITPELYENNNKVDSNSNSFRLSVSNDNSIVIQALDGAVHSNLNLKVTARSRFQAPVSNQIDLAFLPPLKCQFSVSSNPLVNNNVTITAYTVNPSNGALTNESLAGFDYVAINGMDYVSGIGSNTFTLKFNQRGPFKPGLRFKSTLRNQFCTWPMGTDSSITPDYLVVPLTIN